MKNNPVKITPKGYYYDTKTKKRISKKEAFRREKISESLKKYWKEKKETELVSDILDDIVEELEITDELTGTP